MQASNSSALPTFEDKTMTHTITITRENLDQLAKGIAASVNRLGFRKQGKEMVPSQAIRVLAERLGMNEHALVKSLKAQAHAATVALPVTPSRTERSFVLGSLGKDELLDILADKGCYEADMERWTADALRAEILDKEFTAECPDPNVAQQFAALTKLGYRFSEDSDQEGLWLWHDGVDGCDCSFETFAAAVLDAWLRVSKVARAVQGIRVATWAKLSIARQAVLIEASLEQESDSPKELDDALTALEAQWGNEHPWYGRDEWREDVSNGTTKRGYWEWVLACIEANGGSEAHCSSCGQPSGDGNGWDGLCGDCADKEEGEKPMSSPAMRDLADQAFEHYDFGDDVTVADHEGWESCTGDTVLSKTVFLEELNAPEKPSRKVTFRVNVENGAVTDVSVTS